MHIAWNAATAVVAAAVLASPAAAQRRLELGVDAGAVFGLGDQSSVNVSLPGSRFRVGFFQLGSNLSIEPAAGFSYDKVEGTDGIFTYNLELGALYHFKPLVDVPILGSAPITRVAVPYVRPFIGVTGFTGGGSDDSEFILGAGLGTRVPFRRDLPIRLEGNIGYGFDNKATRLGLLVGLSYFPR